VSTSSVEKKLISGSAVSYFLFQRWTRSDPYPIENWRLDAREPKVRRFIELEIIAHR
jgi:hypothetical protein